MNILTYRIFMEYLYIILYEMLFLFLFQLVDHKRRLGYTCRAKGSAEWGKIQQKNEMLFLFLFQLVDHKRRLGYTCRAKGSAEWGKIQQKVTGNWQSLIATQGVKIQ